MSELTVEKDTVLYLLTDVNDTDQLRLLLNTAEETEQYTNKDDRQSSYLLTPTDEHIHIPQTAIKHIIATGGAKLITETEYCYKKTIFEPNIEEELNFSKYMDTKKLPKLIYHGTPYFNLWTPDEVSRHQTPSIFESSDKQYYLSKHITFEYKSKSKDLKGFHKKVVIEMLKVLKQKYPMFDFLASKTECSTRTIQTEVCEETEL